MWKKYVHGFFGRNVEFLSIICNCKRLWNINFRRFVINNFNSNFEPKGECCTFEMADVGAHLRKSLCLTGVSICNRNSKIWLINSIIYWGLDVNLCYISDLWSLLSQSPFLLKMSVLEGVPSGLDFLNTTNNFYSMLPAHSPICSLKGESSGFLDMHELPMKIIGFPCASRRINQPFVKLLYKLFSHFPWNKILCSFSSSSVALHCWPNLTVFAFGLRSPMMPKCKINVWW